MTMQSVGRPVEAPPDREAIAALTRLGDYMTPIALRVVADLGIADLLADGALPVDELAERTGSHAGALCRVLRALAGQGLFHEGPAGVFALTPVSELLRRDHPHSLKDAYQLMRADLEAWASFDVSVATGGGAFEQVHGQPYWAFLDAHPDEKERFERSIWTMTRFELPAVLAVYDWSRIGHLVDLGGGSGQVMAGLLAANPAMRGTLLDLPHVAPGAAPALEAAGVADRCEIVTGDFLVEVPAGGDGYLLKRVLYDFDEDQATTILTNVRAAIAGDGRLLMLDGIIRPDNRYDMAKVHDMFVLGVGRGRARTRAELKDLLARTGFRLRRVIPTGVFPLLEAEPS